MEKYFKYILILIIVFGLLAISRFFIKPVNSETIKNYLLNIGFVEDMYDDSYLTKVLSSTTVNHFSTSDFIYSSEIKETNSNVLSTLFETYDFKNKSLSFNYRIEYGNNINVLYNGTYNDNKYLCNRNFATASLDNRNDDNTCNLIKIRVQRFLEEAQVLFNNYNYIEYMEKNSK